MKALVGAFNQEKALVGSFSMIVKTGCGTDGALHSTSVLCGAVKGLCLLQHLSGVLGKLQPGPRQETLPSAECKHALFNGDPASAALFAQLCNSAILGRLQGDQQQNE